LRLLLCWAAASVLAIFVIDTATMMVADEMDGEVEEVLRGEEDYEVDDHRTSSAPVSLLLPLHTRWAAHIRPHTLVHLAGITPHSDPCSGWVLPLRI
jgi:hypothetical protein